MIFGRTDYTLPAPGSHRVALLHQHSRHRHLNLRNRSRPPHRNTAHRNILRRHSLHFVPPLQARDSEVIAATAAVV